MNINDVPHILAISRDITSIAEAERDLRLSQKKYEELIQFARDGILLLDTEGKVEMVNPAFLELTGTDIGKIRDIPFNKIPGFQKRRPARICPEP